MVLLIDVSCWLSQVSIYRLQILVFRVRAHYAAIHKHIQKLNCYAGYYAATKRALFLTTFVFLHSLMFGCATNPTAASTKLSVNSDFEDLVYDVDQYTQLCWTSNEILTRRSMAGDSIVFIIGKISTDKSFTPFTL
jgi:hypothetical protein